jgi:hypothetical protein
MSGIILIYVSQRVRVPPMTPVEISIPDTHNNFFWFIFSFGLWGALASTFIALFYFVVFIQLTISDRRALVSINLATYTFFGCVLFSIATIARALKLGHVRPPLSDSLGFIIGILLPLAVNGILHRERLWLWWLGRKK